MATAAGWRRRSPIRMARLVGFGVKTLVRKDVRMAKEEIADKVRRAGLGAGLFGAAGVIAVVALGALSAGAILALAIVVPGWAAALIVGALWLTVAGMVALVGKRNIRAATPPAPTETARTVKRDVRSLAGELRQGKERRRPGHLRAR